MCACMYICMYACMHLLRDLRQPTASSSSGAKLVSAICRTPAGLHVCEYHDMHVSFWYVTIAF